MFVLLNIAWRELKAAVSRSIATDRELFNWAWEACDKFDKELSKYRNFVNNELTEM